MLNNGLHKNSNSDDDNNNLSVDDDIDQTSICNENLNKNLKEILKNSDYDYNFDKHNEEIDNLKDNEMEINDLKLTYSNKGKKEGMKIENINLEKQEIPKEDSQNKKLIISNEYIVESYNLDQNVPKVSNNKEDTKYSNNDQTVPDNYNAIQKENAVKDENKDLISEKKKKFSNEKIDISCEKLITNEKNRNESNVELITNTNSVTNSYINNTTINKNVTANNTNKYGLLMRSINQNEKSASNDNPQEQNIILSKLNQAEKEYFTLKRILAENMLTDEAKLNNLEGVNYEKMNEILNRQNIELIKYYDKFSQIDIIMKSVEYLEVNKSKQVKITMNDKILETSKRQHNSLTLRLSQITTEDYESSLETVLSETINQINHFENQNRVSRHSKKKSEIKFNKTQKLATSIDSKKIKNEFNEFKQQSDNLDVKINKNKKCIEDKEAKINGYKEDLSKLKEIAEFYGITELDMKYLFVNSVIDINNPNDIDFITNKKSELMKKYESLNKLKDARMVDYEKSIKQNINHIKELDNKKNNITLLIKEKSIKAEAENEKVKELYYINQISKYKPISDKFVLEHTEIVRNCKKDKLETIDEKDNEELCRNNRNVDIIEYDNFVDIIKESDNKIDKIDEGKIKIKVEDNQNEEICFVESDLKNDVDVVIVKNPQIELNNEEIKNVEITNELQSSQQEINKMIRNEQVTDVENIKEICENPENSETKIEINEKKDEKIEIITNKDKIDIVNIEENIEKQANSPKNVSTIPYLADKSPEIKENTVIIKENIQFKTKKIEVDQTANEDNLTKINPIEIQNKYKRDNMNKENLEKKNVEKKEDALLFIKDYTPKYSEETILNPKDSSKKESLNKNSTEKVKNPKTESKKKNPTKEEQKSLFSDVFNEGEDEVKPSPKENKQINQKRKDFDQLFQSDVTTETILLPNKIRNNHTSQRNDNTSKKKTKTIDDLDDLIL